MGPHRSVLVVDVQPEYVLGNYQLVNAIAKLAEDCANSPECDEVLVLFNGYESFGEGPTEENLREWYRETDAEALADADFYDKGYAFFRPCMDFGFAHDAIVPLVRWMYQRGITDSRDIDYAELRAWIAGTPTEEWDEELLDFLESEQDVLGIPNLMKELKPLSEPIAVVGGERRACLAEVLIALEALGKEYEVIEALTYI